MESAITAYLNFTTSAVGLIQRLGLLSIPLGVAVTVIVNFLGGEKAIRAVGIAILVMAVLNIVLASAMGLGSWMGGAALAGTAPAPPSGH